MKLWIVLCLCCLVVVTIISSTQAFVTRRTSPPTLRISTTQRRVFNKKTPSSQAKATTSSSSSKRTKTISKPATYDVKPATPAWKSVFTLPKSESTLASVETNVRKMKAKETTKSFNDNAAAAGNSELTLSNLLLPIGFLAAVVVSVGTGVAINVGMSPSDVAAALQEGISDPQAVLQGIINSVQAMGPVGAFYFGLFYCIAELLAVPATPLTLSAGTLFGLGYGVGIVLTAGTVAACVGFLIGKTFLRSYVEGVVADNPKFSKLDNAIGKDGFKLLVLVRLSPIFPFSLTNYIYGSSSIDFVPFFWGTLLGFTPSTIAYVYTGMVGQELLMGDATQPWYVYVGGLGALLTLLKLVTDVASGLVEAIEEGDEDR